MLPSYSHFPVFWARDIKLLYLLHCGNTEMATQFERLE